MLRIPSYRRHKPTGQARVALGGNDFYLGRYGAPEVRKRINARSANTSPLKVAPLPPSK